MTREIEGTENTEPAEAPQATTATTPETRTLSARLDALRVRISTWASVRPGFVTQRAPS